MQPPTARETAARGVASCTVRTIAPRHVIAARTRKARYHLARVKIPNGALAFMTIAAARESRRPDAGPHADRALELLTTAAARRGLRTVLDDVTRVLEADDPTAVAPTPRD